MHLKIIHEQAFTFYSTLIYNIQNCLVQRLTHMLNKVYNATYIASYKNAFLTP